MLETSHWKSIKLTDRVIFTGGSYLGKGYFWKSLKYFSGNTIVPFKNNGCFQMQMDYYKRSGASFEVNFCDDRFRVQRPQSHCQKLGHSQSDSNFGSRKFKIYLLRKEDPATLLYGFKRNTGFLIYKDRNMVSKIV